MSESPHNVPESRPVRSLWSLLTLAGVLAGVWFLFEQFSETTPAQDTPPELADEPDLYIEGAIISQFRTDGALKYRLASDKIRHFELDRVTHLTEPELTLYNINAPPWHIESKRGDIRQKPMDSGGTEEVVHLMESVAVKQKFADGRHTSLYAPTLDLYPDRQYAETDEDVMIDTDVGRTQAVGLKADLERSLLKLSSTAEQRVHTIVLPGQFK